MALYLNTNRQYQNYKELTQEKYFVDKSEIISLINENINTKSKYVCITRPRRFGKSSVADMLGAYYCKAVDSKYIFDDLNISKNPKYLEKLNKYNVISVSFAEVDNNCKNCTEYIQRVSDLIIEDLKESFPNIKIKENYAIWDIFSELDEKFIFIFDEWDYIFNANLFEKDQDKFLE
ncbi:MAG: AAA family ATPase, partial [Peptostreptococcaceae bacterium]